MDRLKNISSGLKYHNNIYTKKIQKAYFWSNKKIEKRPITSLFAVIAILFVLVVLGNIFRAPTVEEKDDDFIVKNVEVFSIGDQAEITTLGQIEKSGIITIVAQTSGIVNEVNVKIGEKVVPGKKLISLASNYQGSSAPSIQRQIAGTQYQNVKDTLDTQRELIGKQRELTNKQDENADQLRQISDSSIGRTEDLLDFNNSILDSVNSNLEELETNNPDGINDDVILNTKQLKSQILSTVGQLQTGLENTRYQSDDNNPQAEISNLTREIALKQLDIQERALDLSLKTAGLQLQLAQIQESVMFPVSPINAVVDRIFVKEGQSVSPGTPLLIIHGDQKLQLISKIPFETAQLVDKERMSKISINNNEISIYPTHISIDATDGSLSTIIFNIPALYENSLSNNSSVSVTLPLRKLAKNNSAIYIPIDAIHHLPDGAIVYVIDGDKAKAINIELGSVSGSFVEIKSTEVSKYSHIILSRNISDSDHVTF